MGCGGWKNEETSEDEVKRRALKRRYGRSASGLVHAITVVGRRWFNGGNTYFSAEIFMNGKRVHRIPFEYGYGDAYVQQAGEWLIKNGYVKAEKYKHGGYPPLWRLAKEQGFEFAYSVSDVARKKDL
jgi:hypothetical protein